MRFLGLVFLFSFSSVILGQPKLLELLPGAEKTEIDLAKGTQKLTGNVRFTYQGNVMYCDSALYLINKKQVFAYGKVHINSQDTLNLFCDSLRYDDASKIAKLWSNVRIRDRYYKIETDSLEFHTKRETMTYRYGAIITNETKNEKLTSKTGTYARKTEVFNFGRDVFYESPQYKVLTDTMRYKTKTDELFFFGKTHILDKDDSTEVFCNEGYFDLKNNKGFFKKMARIIQPNLSLSGQELTYDGNTKYAEGRGEVRLYDQKEKIEVFCGHAISNSQEKWRRATEAPIVFSYRDSDTSYLLADTLILSLDSLDEVISTKAFRNVQFASKDYSAVCDSLVSHKADSTTKMFGAPMLWNENNQMSGEYMEVLQDSTSIKRAFVQGSSLSVSEVEKDTYYNQVAGREMTGYFNDGKLQLVHVEGNAITIYFVEEETENDTSTVVKRQGMSKLVSSELKVYLDSGEVHRVTYFDEPEGVHYDMKNIPAKDLKTQGFIWKPEGRPQSPMAKLEEMLTLFPKPKELSEESLNE